MTIVTEKSEKQDNVPLEEALSIAGTGWYTVKVMLVTGMLVFSALLGMQMMSIVIPAAGCDLQLSVTQKGVLTSMSFSGMIFSSHLFGFLADTCGRKKVLLVCNLITVCLTVLSSLAPNATCLMVITFINGFVLGGVFTPAYVFVSEFCPVRVRARGLLVCSAVSSMATVYLPCLAWLIMPLDIHIPLYGGVVFTSWRLYLALLAIPSLLINLLLRQFPETPKYVLNSGDEKTTLETLRTIYSVNMRKSKDDYPVSHVTLDLMDRISHKEMEENCRPCLRYIKAMIGQTKSLFTQPFLPYTVMSCAILFGIVGVYNTIILWIPEQTRQLMLYRDNQPYYNVTLCEAMSIYSNIEDEGLCEVNYEIFITSLVIGLLQCLFFLIIGMIADRISGKILIVFFCSLTAAATVVVLFVRSFLLSVASLGSVAILLLTSFPVSLSIAVDNFPTSLRSTATSIIMLCGRTGAAVGSQVVGALLQSHCTTAYWIMIGILVGVVILCLFIPAKKK